MCVIRHRQYDVRGFVDFSLQKVREYHRKWKEEGQGTRDVVIVAHGHFNRCLIARWIGLPLSEGARLKNWVQ
jgi:probable phosphoglycerate mutase